jgi:thiamine biosynthesis lipoprotein
MRNNPLLIFLSAVLIFSGCAKEKLYKDTRILMGTFVEVTSPNESAAKIVFSEIKRIEDKLSKYNASSEVARLNKLRRLKVSPETFFIIKRSKELSRLTNGAFDITVAPLVTLWGFKDKNFYTPEQREIDQALKLTGSDKIILNERDYVVEFKLSGMQVDLGAIAKGYAVDCAVRKLREAGINSCLINAGGQIYALGDKLGLPWKVAIRNPKSKSFLNYIYIKDKAVSTSGNYEQYFDSKGKRYGHIFNPKTGYPSESEFASVTVVAPDGVTADALSTSVFVLGKEKGKELVDRFQNTELITITDE